jgi:hypothetical protein
VAGFETIGELYNACKFRVDLGEALALTCETNGYLDCKTHWLTRTPIRGRLDFSN